jgi:hypothetical protein
MPRSLQAFFGCLLLIFAQGLSAQIRFQAPIDHIRFDAVNGVVLVEPETIVLTDDVEIVEESGLSISLADLENRQISLGQQHWLRIALTDAGTASRVEVLGVDPVFPTNLNNNEITILIRDVNTDNSTILPDSFPFIEIAPLTLDAPGTSIFDADERRISLSELQSGAIVQVSGHFDETAFKADVIRVLHSIVHTGFGGTVLEVRRNGDQTELIFGAEYAEWLDRDVEVHVDDDFVGTGIEAVRAVLTDAASPLSAQMTDHNDHNGKFRRVRFFEGTTLGKRWENDHEVTMQVQIGAEGIGEEHEEGFGLKPAATVFPIPASVSIWDHVRSNFGQTEQGTVDDLEPFINVWINVQLAGSRVVSADININERPVYGTFDLRVGWRDRASNRVNFDTGGSIHLLPSARILDVSGNSLPGLHQFWELQHEHQAVAVVTIDATTGRGTEARLVPFDELGDVDDNQVVIGAVVGIHRGFWTNAEEGEIGNHGLDGFILDATDLTDASGRIVSEALLESGVGATVTGALVSGNLYIQNIQLQGTATAWSFTTRIQDFNPQGNWMQFEESDPIRIDREAEVFDHFGGPASLQFIQELFQRGDLQLLMTFGESVEDGSRIVTRVEAFRHDASVDEGPNQELISSGRLDPWSNPALIYPQEIREVNFGLDTEIIGLDGRLIQPTELDKGVRVQVDGFSIVKADPNQFSSRTHNAVTRIEVLGGIATQFQGFVADISGTSIHFKAPEPLSVSQHTDFQEETGFRIDFFTLASRIESEGGLRMWLSGEFGVPGGGQVWWGRVMRSDEPNPSFLHDDQTIATVIGVDAENRALIRAPIPEVQITSDTEIKTRSGESIPQTDIITDALVTVVTEERNGSTIAIELTVDRIPQSFSLTAPVGYVDANQRFIEFQVPPFMGLTDDAEIFGADGTTVDLAGLKAILIGMPRDNRALRVTVTPDSPTDAPIIRRIAILGDVTEAVDGDNEFTLYIDEPEYQIRVFDRRIEPTPLPKARILTDTEIVSADGSPIDLHDIRSGMRIQVTGQDSDGRIALTQIRVVGGSVFVGEGVISRIDIPNRLIYPEPDPAVRIDQRAHISDESGSPITLEAYARLVSENNQLVVVVEFNPFDKGIVSLGVFNPEFGRPHGENVGLWDASEVEIDTTDRLLAFREEPPARLATDAAIVGPQGDPLTIEDLQAGQRAFVRGEEVGDDVVITAITIIPEIDRSDLAIQTGDFDEDGTENDIVINLLDQDGNAIALPLKVFFDFRAPFEARSGHIMTDVPAGPHVVRVEVASRPEIHDEERVFISVHGSTLAITETFPTDSATGVATDSEIRITFNEAIQQFGDFVSVEGDILPEPLSSDDEIDFSLADDGTVLVLSNVLFAENTSYTINISSASSRSGATLGDPVQVRFSTGSTLLELGSLSGRITFESDLRFVGTVHLFDRNNERVQEARVSDSGSFAFNAVFEGDYTIVAEALAEDGTTLSGAYEELVSLGPGEARAGLDILIALPGDVDQGGTPANTDANVVLDLDTRAGNQELGSLSSLPDSDIRVAVYAQNVSDVIGYNVSFSYDSTAVTFAGVDEGTETEVNLLKKSGGLSLTLPPVVGAASIDFAGAILGSGETAVSGDGILAVFKFKTRNDFSDPAEFLVPRVLIQSRASADTLNTLARATVELAARRILLGVSASADTIAADGQTASRLSVDLKDADGNPVTEETTVRFEIVEGSARLSQMEVVTGDSRAEVDLFGNAAGYATIQVSVEGATSERINIVMEESAPIGSGPLGQIVLDLDTASGDQASRINQSLTGGDEVIVDVVVTEELTAGMSGFEFVLLFDSGVLDFSGFNVMEVFAGAAPIVSTNEDTVTVSSVLLGSEATQPSGTIGQATFIVREDAARDATIALQRAQLGGPDGRLQLTLGSGGSTVLLGVGTAPITPDFDGDGSVGFLDFIAFAGVFGETSGSANYDARFDLDGSGDIGFSDFLVFAQAFGSSAKQATKPAIGTGAALDLMHSVEDLGNGMSRVHFEIAENQAAQAYGFTLSYDADAATLESVSTDFASSFGAGDQPAIAVSTERGNITFADYGLSDPEGRLVSITFQTDGPIPSVNLTGINLVDLSGNTTQVSDRSIGLAVLPDRMSLDQNYPNPFNPETVIPFALPQSGLTRISVYNLVGQEIAVLIDGHKEAGRHTVRWNGQDAFGRSASSGIYFVRMHASSGQAIRKVVLMK